MAQFSDNARTILAKRYLAYINGEQETEDAFIERISMGNPEYKEYLIEPLNFLPNSPTLFNLNVPGGGTLSACFKFDVADTMLDGSDGIMDTATKAAMVTKWGGGVGYYVGAIRPAGARVNSTHGKAMGPVAVLRYYNAMAKMLTQSGKREAAQMGIIEATHPDVREFIHMKDEDPQGLSTFNISVSLSDEFMEKAIASPTGSESALLRDIASSAWRTGDPGVYFVDRAERDNPTPFDGRLSGTNPCGEVPLLNNEPCNLGSINLRNFVNGSEFDWNTLGKVTRLAVQYLDDVLDRNHFPDYRITAAANYTRKLGLGVCGWADSLALMRIPYASNEAVELLGKVMQFIREKADDESERLGKSKRTAPCFVTQRIVKRNATTLCIAPTGSIAILMGASSGIEPHFLTNWSRTMGDGTVLYERIPVMDEIGDFKPQTAMEIPWEWHIRHQAAAQKHVDLAVSKTINMPNEATVDDIYNAYVMMWQEGCKGGTVFRDGCRDEQVLARVHESEDVTITVTTTQHEVCAECGSNALAHHEGCVDCLSCGWSVCSV